MSSLNEWYSAQKLAAMKLSGLPATDSAIMRLAKKNLWSCRSKARGKGLEYKPPAPVLTQIKQQQLRQMIQGESSASNQSDTPTISQNDSTINKGLLPEKLSGRTAVEEQKSTVHLKDWQRVTAEARKAICDKVRHLSQVEGTEKTICKIIELAASNSLPPQLQQLVPLANARSGKEGKRTLSRRSIYRWLGDAEGGVATLAPKPVEKIQMPSWAGPLMTIYGQPQKPPLTFCLEQLRKLLPYGAQLPSYSAADRFIKKMSKVDAQRGRMGNRELKNIRPFVRRDTSQMWPGDAYTADGHTFDAEIAHPAHGKAFRPEITSVLDIATRRLVGWSVGLAESTWAVLDALRHACQSGGIPAVFYVDNGSGYKNAAMSAEATGFMARLSITITHSLPYNSQARGIEERSHQSIWVRGAKQLPTYIGAPMDREARQKSFKITRADLRLVGQSKLLMPWFEFVAWCQEQADDYNNRNHRGLPKIYDPVIGKRRHQTPNEAWEAAIKEGWQPFPIDAHDADDLFRPYKEAQVRRGEIKLFNNIYFSHNLEAHHGETVRVGYDIHDASRVWVRNQAGQLITVAEFEANKRSYFPQSFIDQAAEKRAKGRLHRINVKADEIEQELNPPQQLVHESVMELPTYTPRAIESQVDKADVEIVETTPVAQVVSLQNTRAERPIFDTDAAKYRWLMRNSTQCTDIDQAWINYYRLTAEWEDLFGDREVAAG